jgi:hypothetical protein
MAVLEEDPAPVPAADSTSGASDDEITVEETSFVHTEPPQDGTAPPVVTSDMEVLNDKVKKQVIKEGHGKKPSRLPHALFTIEHGFKVLRTNSRILGKNSIQLN